MDDHIKCSRRREELALLRFGALEGRVLRVLWEYDEATLADLRNLIADPGLSVASLCAVLDRMRLKRLIHLRKVHRTHYYRAARDEATFIRLLHAQLAGFLGADGMVRLLHAGSENDDRDEDFS